jgi:hypothetical protein
MRTHLVILFVLFAAFCSKTEAAAIDRITATIAVTNAPIGNTNKITINGNVRSFTNSVTASPGTLVQETNSIPWTATNLLDQLTAYRISQFHFLGSSASTNVRITGDIHNPDGQQPDDSRARALERGTGEQPDAGSQRTGERNIRQLHQRLRHECDGAVKLHHQRREPGADHCVPAESRWSGQRVLGILCDERIHIGADKHQLRIVKSRQLRERHKVRVRRGEFIGSWKQCCGHWKQRNGRK